MARTSIEIPVTPKRLNYFERYLTLWVGLCMLAGVLVGKALPGTIDQLRRMEFGAGSQINVPIAVLIWLMIVPDDDEGRFRFHPERGQEAAWPSGDPLRELAGEAVLHGIDRLAILPAGHFRLAIIARGRRSVHRRVHHPRGGAVHRHGVRLELSHRRRPGRTRWCRYRSTIWSCCCCLRRSSASWSAARRLCTCPSRCCCTAVGIFIVIPLVGGFGAAHLVHSPRTGRSGSKGCCCRASRPSRMLALLATLVLIFAFQADNITGKPFHVVLIAIPILLQVYFNSSLAYGLMRLFKVQYAVAAPGALIGASNFLRARRGDGHRAVRSWFGSGPGDGGRRPGRGAGDAVGLLLL